MAETANIGEIAAKLSKDIFKHFFGKHTLNETITSNVEIQTIRVRETSLTWC